jgi:nitrite reductase/ring-hydroxylating ferredoxin subunit
VYTKRSAEMDRRPQQCERADNPRKRIVCGWARVHEALRLLIAQLSAPRYLRSASEWLMGLLKTILLGRENGMRRSAARKFGLGGAAPAPGSPPPSASASEPAERALGLRREAPKDVTPPDGYEVVLHKDALDPGRIIEIIIGGTAIAVANVGGTYYALSNACAHAEGPLGEGSLDGHIVTCPYHGWQYDVRDGGCKTTAGAKVASYAVQVVGDAICVKM